MTTDDVVVGIVTHIIPQVQQQRQQQRHSWMRSNVMRSNSSGNNNNGNNDATMIQNLQQLLEEESDAQEESSIDSSVTTTGSSSTITTTTTTTQRDSLIGRIGTMVTITNTHHGNADDILSQQQQQQEQDEIVVTALGTTRFRIVKPVDNHHDNTTTTNHSQNRQYGGSLKWYSVQELNDDDVPLPHSSMFASTTRPHQHQQQMMIHQLSMVSPIPSFCYAHAWPWKLMEDIRSKLHIVGLTNGNDNDTHIELSSPTRFSFWLASNMPLSESDKLHVLNMDDETTTTLKRLQYLHNKLKALIQVQTQQAEQQVHYYSCCKRCKTFIAPISQLFTVGGADGTTGAYVNEYGVIHQTMTFLNVVESELLYSGRPETKDSWFPGYSWTIAHCATCHLHLGWKFIRVTQKEVLSSSTTTTTESSSIHRPLQFWGLSGSSVTTTL